MSLVNSFPGGNGGSEITVDDALSATSENPVQNKVIKGVLDTTYKTTDGSVSGVFQDDDYFPYLSPGYTPPQKRIKGAHIKATLKNYFDTLYSTIKTSKAAAQGGTDLSLVTTGEKYAWNNPSSIPIVANQFDKANIYSTTEKIVGCWIDGRPIYQKTVNCGLLPNSNTTRINHNISNIKEVLDIYGHTYAPGSSSFIVPLPTNNAQGNNDPIRVAINPTVIVIETTREYTSTYTNDVYITVRYTKTTDAANSFNYADENDYSTTEHVVGKWIDGKPIYQKTISFTVSTTAIQNIPHGISNLKYGWIKENFIPNSNDIMYSLLDSEWFKSLDISKTNIVLTKGEASHFGGVTAIVTLQYTKTTD